MFPYKVHAFRSTSRSGSGSCGCCSVFARHAVFRSKVCHRALAVPLITGLCIWYSMLHYEWAMGTFPGQLHFIRLCLVCWGPTDTSQFSQFKDSVSQDTHPTFRTDTEKTRAKSGSHLNRNSGMPLEMSASGSMCTKSFHRGSAVNLICAQNDLCSLLVPWRKAGRAVSKGDVFFWPRQICHVVKVVHADKLNHVCKNAINACILTTLQATDA